MMLHRDFIFIKKIKNCYLLYSNNQNDKIIVWCFEQEKLNIDCIKEFINLMDKEKYKSGMIIYQSMLTSSTKKLLDNLYKFEIELFLVKELQYDLTKFKYYCIHEKLSSDDAKKIKEQFGNSLPFILKTDIVSRYFHFQKNDIIKITRRNGTIAYRVVK
jgi:DNA-directed RNA polymerase subunit H (RpoH/RPB5)